MGPVATGVLTIDVKNVFLLFLFWSRFLLFKSFISKKHWQSSERQAD